MDAASSSTIREVDLVGFKPTAAHGDRGRVLNASPSKRHTLVVQCVDADGAAVEVKASDSIVLDRCYLFPGIVVASDAGGGQLGVVTGVARALDLVRYDGGDCAVPVTSGVPPGELRRVRGLCLGDCVVSSSSSSGGGGGGGGAWLGRVVEVSLDVDVAFDDGAVCKVADAVSKLIITLGTATDHLHRHTNPSLYPGQRVAGKHCSVFKASTWLRGYWKPTGDRDEGTVVKVEMAGVLVHWVASSRLGSDRNLVSASAAAAPPAYQNPRDLTFFCSPPVCYWSVGDRCYWSGGGGVCATATASSGGDIRNRTSRRIAVKRLRRRRRRRRVAEFERPLYVAYTSTTADVVWQDGTRQCGVASASLLPFVTRNTHDFFPGQHVVRRPHHDHDDEDDGADAPGRIGVVRSLHCNHRTVRVSWFKATGHPAGEANEEFTSFDHDEIMSAYDLALAGTVVSSDHNVFYGDLVVRRLHGESMDEDDIPMLAQSNRQMAPGAADDMSWVGHVIDLCHDGHVQVRWGNHHKSKVLPHEIAVVKLQPVSQMLREMGDWVYDDGDMDDDLDDHAPEGSTAEPVPATENNDSNNGNGDGDPEDGDSEAEDADGLVEALAPPTAGGIRGVIQRASGVLAHCKKYIASELLALVPGSGGGNGGDVQGAAMASSSSGGNGEGRDGNGYPDSDHIHRQGKEGADEANDADTSGGDSFRFRQFDVVVRSPPDHHYLDNREQLGGQRKWTKRVQKEWKILENNLPDGIYTRVFEDRMDLLRAVIVGASGTPYQDGLFFFDLQLPPSSYPSAPPLVSYRSFGLSGVNPNLSASGTVCLSLLGTFGGGEGAELWRPGASTLLQVLVSIQGLVLNVDRPYYNEAAFAAQAGTPEGRRNELPYSENACLLTLQSMLQLLRRPPAGFEGLVASHFARRGRRVLRACEAYLEGCRVGTLDADGRRRASAMEGSAPERPCSAGFRLALANVVPRLVEAFTAIGAEECDEFARDRLRVAASLGTSS